MGSGTVGSYYGIDLGMVATNKPTTMAFMRIRCHGGTPDYVFMLEGSPCATYLFKLDNQYPAVKTPGTYTTAEGYIKIVGRKKDMLISGGFNVYPAEIEDLLARHPRVARAAVLGVPDERLGEIGWAFVVPRDPAAPPTLEELRAFVGAELASFKRPDGLSVVPELPVTPMFKVDKRALRGRWDVAAR